MTNRFHDKANGCTTTKLSWQLAICIAPLCVNVIWSEISHAQQQQAVMFRIVKQDDLEGREDKYINFLARKIAEYLRPVEINVRFNTQRMQMVKEITQLGASKFFIEAHFSVVGPGIGVEMHVGEVVRKSASKEVEIIMKSDPPYTFGLSNVDIRDDLRTAKHHIKIAFLPTIDAMMHDDNRERIFAHCIMPSDRDNSFLSDLSRYVTHRYDNLLQESPFAERYFVRGWEWDDITDSCFNFERDTGILSSAYHHIVSGFLERKAQTVHILWDTSEQGYLKGREFSLTSQKREDVAREIAEKVIQLAP